jgi:hypothetical protein
MMTREEALRRLDAVANELVVLRAALAEGWIERPVEDPTQVFLAKCGGWEDTEVYLREQEAAFETLQETLRRHNPQMAQRLVTIKQQR